MPVIADILLGTDMLLGNVGMFDVMKGMLAGIDVVAEGRREMPDNVAVVCCWNMLLGDGCNCGLTGQDWRF